MRLLAFALLALVVACGRAPSLAPRPVLLPDTIYTASGATPVVLVDSIATPDPRKLILGQYDYLARRLYISRVVKDPMQRQKVLAHETCHATMAESGLQMHFAEAPWLLELICDAMANSALAQLERKKD
jgi:hypothetical protein